MFQCVVFWFDWFHFHYRSLSLGWPSIHCNHISAMTILTVQEHNNTLAGRLEWESCYSHRRARWQHSTTIYSMMSYRLCLAWCKSLDPIPTLSRLPSFCIAGTSSEEVLRHSTTHVMVSRKPYHSTPIYTLSTPNLPPPAISPQHLNFHPFYFMYIHSIPSTNITRRCRSRVNLTDLEDSSTDETRLTTSVNPPPLLRIYPFNIL